MAVLKENLGTVRAPHYAYYRYSSLPERTTEWLQLHIREVIEACDVKDGDYIKILSVGSGQGDPDMVILDNILELGLPVQYTVIEPNSTEAAKFERRVTGKQKYSTVELLFNVMTSEEFTESRSSKGLYDLVLFIHCLYYFQDTLETNLQTFHDMLERNGCLLAITSASSGGWGDVIEQYKNILPMAHFSNEEDLEIVLQKKCWSVKRDTMSFTLDIKPLLADEEPGNALLDFMTGVHEARKVLPQSLIQGILDQLVKMARKDDDQLYIMNPMWVHIIRKSQ